MIGDKNINILCSHCKIDVTIPNILLNSKTHFINCPRCGCGVFIEYNRLGTDKGQPNKVAPGFTEAVNQNMLKKNSGFKLNAPTRLT